MLKRCHTVIMDQPTGCAYVPIFFVFCFYSEKNQGEVSECFVSVWPRSWTHQEPFCKLPSFSFFWHPPTPSFSFSSYYIVYNPSAKWVKTSLFFTAGDLLIVWRFGHDGGQGKRCIIRGGWNQRGYSGRHCQWAAVQSFPGLWLPGRGTGRWRGVTHYWYWWIKTKLPLSFLALYLYHIVPHFISIYLRCISQSLLLVSLCLTLCLSLFPSLPRSSR